MSEKYLNNRDMSWLAFNHRVLEEAANPSVPLLERIKFLAIFSSNLDEFYRVRVPALLALQKIEGRKSALFRQISEYVQIQQRRFGSILDDNIIPQLKRHKVFFLNTEAIPSILHKAIRDLFYREAAGMLQPVYLNKAGEFFPENNKLYQLVVLRSNNGADQLAVVNIPSDILPRFYSLFHQKKTYIIFLDDIIRHHLQEVFPGKQVLYSKNFKITRDAELNLEDDFEEDIAIKIEKKLQKRDYGLATRFLHEPGLNQQHLQRVLEAFHLHKDSTVSGGVHHSFKDLLHFPFKDQDLCYPVQQFVDIHLEKPTLLEEIDTRDIMVHTPYHDYSTVLRFFNELVLDAEVNTIFTTFYRIAADSKIAHALISAARNGKKVIVLVELKARFDEANNLRWSKRMKEAGVKILYSHQQIKVHAKIALAIRNRKDKPFAGLLATGNLNEQTARVYTDHILLTTRTDMLAELHHLFEFLAKKQKPDANDKLVFNHLIVAQFNLQQRFMALIDREVNNFKKGLPAGITIKLNNLEEEQMIRALYKASDAGISVRMLVRSICCLRPGVPGLSDNIIVNRIVDRYLEHGRIFIFENAGQPEVFAGSSDWMIRNIYRRIEVCFPVYDSAIKKQLINMINLQLNDNVQAVRIDAEGKNVRIITKGTPVHSQEQIFHLLKDKVL